MSRPLPSISACVPTFNYRQYLRQSVESLWTQTVLPDEICIVDDGSTDGSWELLEELASESPVPMKLLRGPRRGVSAALNVCTQAASGEWLVLQAADDYARRDRIESLMTEVRPETVLAHSEYACVDKEGRSTIYDSSLDLPAATGSCLRELLLLRADVRSVTVAIRRSSLQAIGWYDESKPAEDWHSTLRLAARGSIAHSREQLVFRRVHGANVSVAGQRRTRPFSFEELSLDVIDEVAPADLPRDLLAVLHASTSIKNSIAQGGFETARQGVVLCWERFPRQRALLLRGVLGGARSWLWLKYLRSRVPQPMLVALLRVKAAAMRMRGGVAR